MPSMLPWYLIVYMLGSAFPWLIVPVVLLCVILGIVLVAGEVSERRRLAGWPQGDECWENDYDRRAKAAAPLAHSALPLPRP
jgi:hypothetical protein